MKVKRDSPSSFIPRLILVIIAITFMVFGARYCATTLNPRSGPVNVTVIVPETPIPTPNSSIPISIGPIDINAEVFDIECGPDGKVISATMAVQISGGIAPYNLKFEPSDTIIPNIQAGSVVRFALQGGHSLTVTVKSNTSDGNPSGSQDIRAPSEASKCDKAKLTSTALLTAIFTNTPIPTNIPTRTKSNNPHPTATLIIISTRPTYTRVDSSGTPPIEPTDTSPSLKTNTPPIESTDTNPSLKTNTPPIVKIGEECPKIIGSKCPLFRDIRVQWDLLSFR